MPAATTFRPAYPEHLRADVERYLEGIRFSQEFATAGLEEAMRYSLLAGGKRIRPVLVLATAHALDRDGAGVLPLAAAIELIHTYSLIHDDLPAMDDDDNEIDGKFEQRRRPCSTCAAWPTAPASPR